MREKIALVTGANKGIGFETCRQLAKNNFKVILTSRDEDKGKESVEKLKKENLDIIYHQLDVIDSESVNNLVKFVIEKFGKLDVLINNAGVLLEATDMKDSKVNSFEFNPEKYGLSLDKFPDLSIFKLNDEIYKKTLDVNLFGALRLCRVLVPLMIKNNYGRVVNISSEMGQLSGQLNEMSGGWPAYRISKTALNCLTKIFAYEVSGYNVSVNCMCPGWVKTDIGGQNAPKNTKEATETIIYLATLPDNSYNGSFFRDKKEIPW